jgi:gamma-glutamylaminecyclotransferase
MQMITMRHLIKLCEDDALCEARPSNTRTVFVYGSLKRGFHNDGLLARSRFVGIGHTKPRYTMVDLGSFPAIIPGGHIISGELYDVNRFTMRKLDQLEGNGGFYVREEIPIMRDDGQVSAWCYMALQNDDDDQLVEPVDNVVTWVKW